ncbi:MAG: hypothetical protein NVS9B4_16260 [Candidatus Acidiferrum sp.]
MAATDQFTRVEFRRILDVSDKQLNYWEKLHLIAPRKGRSKKLYDFRDLISLRTAKQLIEKGVSANRLRRSLSALNVQLTEVRSPLTELRIRSDGRDVIVERAGRRQEPISGQFLLNFDTRELKEKVRVMPRRSAAEWFALALQHDSLSGSQLQAQEAYRRVLTLEAGHVDALTNLGMLHYEQGNLQEAVKLFTRAVRVQPHHAVVRFNLGSVLDEMGELEQAREHLRLASSLDSSYADAHYNLAFVCEKLGSYAEAHEHWRIYVALDPSSKWSNYARQRLNSRIS